MSAISHGWHPSQGDVAKIPVSVAREFHSADAGHKYGKGHDKKKADGGRAALDVAFAEKRRARAEGGQVFEGPIVSAVPGRTDKHEMDVASGSYVLPSSHIASLGEDNTLAGMEHIRQIGPHGIRKLAHSAKGARDIISKHRLKRAVGGATDDNTGHPIPVVTAGGEHVMSPDDVRIVGDGDVSLGHRLLDNWVVQNRKSHIKELRSLAPPAKD